MGKPPLLPYSPYRKYSGEELEKLRQDVQGIDYTRAKIERQAKQLKEQLEELRERWRVLGRDKKQMEYILEEYKYKPRNNFS